MKEASGIAIKWGVTAEDNIKREVLEEFGAEVKKVDFMGYRDCFRKLENGTRTHWLLLDYAVVVDPSQVTRNEPEMADEIGWFTLDKQPKPVHSQHRIFMDMYHKQIVKILIRR